MKKISNMPASLRAKLEHDKIVYGVSVCCIVERKSWNPMRVVFGDLKYKRLDISTLYFEKYDHTKTKQTVEISS